MMQDDELYEIFQRAAEKINLKIQEEFEFGNYMLSNRFKRKMNRIFRERVGIKNNIPHPEVDNQYERIRSGIIRAFLVLADRARKNIK